MKGSRIGALCAVLVMVTAVACCAANHYQLMGWRQWSGAENGQSGPGTIGNSIIRVFVMNEAGFPDFNTRVWALDNSGAPAAWFTTAEYGCTGNDPAYQLIYKNPMMIKCSDNTDSYTSTSDVTPRLWNHDNHRSYDVYFVKRTAPDSVYTFDTGIRGLTTEMNSCPSTLSMAMNTPLSDSYYSGQRTLLVNSVQSFGQTFVANGDRATVIRAHLTKGYDNAAAKYRNFRFAVQLFEGGPDGPPMGPKKNLQYQYSSDDLKRFVSYGIDECALKPGNTYYAKFTAADASVLNAFVCVNDIYPGGTLYVNDAPVPGEDLECHVINGNSGNSNVGTVAGTVRDADGQPINEASIVLSSGKTISTGKLGTYKCYNVVPGTYTMTVSAPGYQPAVLSEQTVIAGETLTTDFTLQKDAGPIDIVSTTGGSIQAGATDVTVSMTARSTTGQDCFVNSASLTFWKDSTNGSSYFTVTPSPSNPIVIRGNQTATFNFTVDSSASTPAGSYAVQGWIDANVNLQPNGSFEQESEILDYQGPTLWDWKSDDPVGVARLSNQERVAYSPSFTVTSAVAKARMSWTFMPSAVSGTSDKVGMKLYLATGSVRVELRLKEGAADQYMSVTKGTVTSNTGGTGTGSAWKYYWAKGVWYTMTLEHLGNGTYTLDITASDGSAGAHVVGGLDASTGNTVLWGNTGSSSLLTEMWTREAHTTLYDANDQVLWNNDWLAVNQILPTASGWRISNGSAGSPSESMLIGVPWLRSTWFNVVADDKKDGSRAMQVWCAPSGGGDGNLVMLSTGSGILKPRMAVKPNTSYTVSFWYKQHQYTPKPAQLRVIWEEYDAAGNMWYHHPNPPGGSRPDYAPPFHWDFNEVEAISHDDWRFTTYTFVTGPTAATAEIQLRMDKNSDPANPPVSDVFTFDDFRLFEVNSYADTVVTTPGALVVQESAVPVASVADAKNKEDGTRVQLTDIPVAGYPAGQTTFFYVEDTNRASGIRVDKTDGTGDLDISEGDMITFTGTLDTVNGERVLTSINITGRTSGSAPKPLGTSGKALGGAALGYTAGVEAGVGLNNVGLLVTVAGQINNAGSGYFYANDGSGLSDGTGTGVKVFLGDVPMQSGKTFVTVTGFSSVEDIDGAYYRVIKPRYAGDIVWY